jgi:hypothetical protein
MELFMLLVIAVQFVANYFLVKENKSILKLIKGEQNVIYIP